MKDELTSVKYWEQYWGSGKPKHSGYDKSRGVFFSYDQLIKDCFAQIRNRTGRRELKFLDCGCGEGLILRFVAEQHPGAEVWGIEYSAAVEKARDLGIQLGLDFHLVRGDLLDEPAPELVGAFDVVASFGLIEHFREPAEILKRLDIFLAKGGCMVTVIPNFHGVYNFLWKLYDSANYRYHVPISWQAFQDAHRALGFEDVAFFTIGPPTIPRPHRGENGERRVLHRMTGLTNKHFLHRFWPRQANLAKRYPMTPLVACVAHKAA